MVKTMTFFHLVLPKNDTFQSSDTFHTSSSKEGWVMILQHLTTPMGASLCARPPLAAAIAVFLLAAVLTGGSIAAANEAVLSPGIWGQNILSNDVGSCHSPVWSHDGQWIATNGRWIIDWIPVEGIFLLSSAGGDYRQVVDGFLNYPYEEIQLKIPQSVGEIGGFSSDGKYLYFTRDIYDEARGAIITVQPNDSGGYHYSASNGFSVLDRVDIDTGEIVELAEGPTWCKVSASGRYLAYNQSATSSLILVRDLLNGETWNVPFCNKNMSFTSDDRFILYSDGDTKLFKVPIEGGDPVQLIAFSGDTGHSRLHTDLSPDGKWVVYNDYDLLNRFSRTIEFRPGRTRGFTDKPPCRLCAFNLETGETVELFPYDDLINPEYGRFSPDGKKFCYILKNYGIELNEYSVYVRDFTPGIQNTGGRTAAAEALPVGFAISGNFPNPFNPSTTISFNLPAAGTASLAVYDITGRKVRDLVNGSLSRGSHSAVWDGRDSAGRSVSTGIYLSRLTMNGKSATNRMLLAK
jgi:hypothetical protein